MKDDGFEVTSERSLASDEYRTTLAVSTVQLLWERMWTHAIERAAELIARRWAEEHYAEVASKLDPQAVANLAIASAGASINETLQKKLPDKVLEVVRTEREVWQRGPLGGMTRIR